MKKLDIMIKTKAEGIKIPEHFKPLFDEILAFCNKNRGGYVRLQVSPPVKKRTTGAKSQSHHINGHVGTISQALQRDPKQVKKYIKYLAIENGYPMLKNEDGNPVLDLWDNYQGISEADSSTEECAILIETCHVYAAKCGIELEEGK